MIEWLDASFGMACIVFPHDRYPDISCRLVLQSYIGGLYVDLDVATYT